MRTKEPVRLVCDGPGCGRVGDGWRESRTIIGPQGPVAVGRIVVPQGWKVARVTPDIAVPPGQQVDPFAPAHEVARMSGATVEAAFCPKCHPKLSFTRDVAPPVMSPEAESIHEALTTAVDERAAERERERLAAEEAAEAAERAAFEAKRDRAPEQTGSEETKPGAVDCADSEATQQMAEWMAKRGSRYVVITPEIRPCQAPIPADILTRGGSTKRLWWNVEVGLRYRRDEDGDYEVFSESCMARTIAAAWQVAITRLRESVA